MDIPAPFMFKPARIEKRLSRFPEIAKEIRPRTEGDESVAFGGWRKSRRQVMKFLANEEPEYGFEESLGRVDHWLGRGFSAAALRARERGIFRAALAELEVADHFAARGFDVAGLDATRAGQPTADMRVVRDDLAATVEVYSPVEWEGLDYFVFDGWDTLRQLDVPYDYVFSFDVTQREGLPPFEEGYRPLHPDELTRALNTADKRRRALQPVFIAALDQLHSGSGHVLAEHVDHALRLSMSIELDHVTPRTTFTPRLGTHGGPGFGGYRPESIFKAVVKRALAKARQGQALTGGDGPSVLIVDMARVQLESELSHEMYQRYFKETLTDLLPADATIPVDLIALCRSPGWRCELHVYWAAWESERIDRATCEALLGDLP